MRQSLSMKLRFVLSFQTALAAATALTDIPTAPAPDTREIADAADAEEIRDIATDAATDMAAL